jgi:hypothetical protein
MNCEEIIVCGGIALHSGGAARAGTIANAVT